MLLDMPSKLCLEYFVLMTTPAVGHTYARHLVAALPVG